MKIFLILLVSGLLLMFFTGIMLWGEVQSYKLKKEKGQLKEWWLWQMVDLVFSFNTSVIGMIVGFRHLKGFDMKGLDELLFDDESATHDIKQWILDSNNINNAIVLPSKKETGENELLNLQVTTKSTLGAVAYSTGGILLQHGWLRILGSGHKELPRAITQWSKECDVKQSLLVADDVVGGFFALNGGFNNEGIGQVFYFAPDTLEWECLEMGYTDFLHWVCTGNLEAFYESFRWSGWETYISNVKGNQGVSIYPPLWSKEANQNGLDNCSKKVVPISELWGINNLYREQLNIKE